ncbi:y4mF family transcriptional regulator [Pedobacter cryoconitis]|uniref:Y4mF family transcriptional regulator n=1 Tax=Pedobacter cryoconitis TaxID=188932 RepID=A0A7W8YYU8_9SPHI|nr:helix-turn-helix transcriptional regulator [Pedobacter cryoconitis]MBB5624060.1 y4mF family transcriptional regulator [Pedobacter cryoconitis]MBB5647294.1 y4mF family transcriptional regulator [Pedobacter cryoconitis]
MDNGIQIWYKIMSPIASFIKEKRKSLKLSQEDLAFKAGVGLRFVRELESGKTTLRLDKVNQVLELFGKQVGITENYTTE